MKIPKPVNAAWDWVEEHFRLIALVVTLMIAASTVLWIPLLAAFVVGATVGGLLVQLRTAGRLTRLRAEADELLRENGSLRHQKTVLASGVLSSQTMLTQRLPTIPEDPE
ncbi:hypothetical protein [Actinomadura sp. HBU206391]|uniref:hypothetical protein n=1 Tax=Actinomadura sp. HBU206391 TaxID=2731692 RepID=UPI00164F0441|nr:hypothetical protein [Actinomadura sp. HBU206391]MBC6459412.1 hypothetical protein [Actinomadura sp. HBU206391]